MLFIDVEDFFSYAATLTRMTRQEEKRCARDMAQGNADARNRLIQSYYPQVVAQIRRVPKDFQTLHTLLCCIASLEKGIDGFDFLQDSETFAHHLSWRLRQCIVGCIAAHE